MITIRQKGNFKKVTGYLERIKEGINLGILNKYGQRGVDALMTATPKDSGVTAKSWYYKIEHDKGIAKIGFYNSNINEGVPIAIILQYGHGTRNGGYVVGRDYINPAVQPIFDDIVREAWEGIRRV